MASDATRVSNLLLIDSFAKAASTPAYTTQNSDSVQFTLDGPDGLYEVDSFSTDIAGNTEYGALSVRLSNTRVTPTPV